MKYLDSVSSEGGPLLIADAEVARNWRGSEEDGADYERACQVFLADPEPPGAFIRIASGQALVWETDGEGTGDVFMDDQGNVTIIRAWLDEPDGADTDDEIGTVTTLVVLPINDSINLGSLDVTSGVLAILWSAENGEYVEALEVEGSESSVGEMATDGSSLVVKVANGRYTCLHDEFELANVSGRRCHLIKQ